MQIENPKGLMKDDGENMRLWGGKELSSWQSAFEPEHHLWCFICGALRFSVMRSLGLINDDWKIDD